MPSEYFLTASPAAFGEPDLLEDLIDPASADAIDRAEQLQVVAPGHGREHRRRLDDCADVAASTRRGPRAPPARAAAPHLSSVARGRGRSGSSWSSLSRWVRENRIPLPRARRGRDRRPRRLAVVQRPYSLRSPSISMTFVPMGHASRFGFSGRQTSPEPSPGDVTAKKALVFLRRQGGDDCVEVGVLRVVDLRCGRLADGRPVGPQEKPGGNRDEEHCDPEPDGQPGRVVGGTRQARRM